MRVFFMVAIALGVFLSGCGRGSSSVVPRAAGFPNVSGSAQFKVFPALPDAVPILDSEINGHIDVDVSPPDRAMLQRVMRALPQTARTNVVILVDNRIIANHRAVVAGAQVVPPDVRSYLTVNGERVTSPQRFTAASTARKIHGVRPPTSDTLGPFQRTWNSENHSYISAYPAIPCAATPFLQPGTNAGPYGDTGYIYFANFTASDDYEGGLQYSRTHDWWVPYQTDYHDRQGQFSLNNYELACGQNPGPPYTPTFRQEFFVVDRDWVAMHYRGYSAQNRSQIVDVTLSRMPGGGSGWSAPCSNCTLSTTNSIAQEANNDLGYWRDGYWFGVRDPFRTLLLNWQQVTLGNCIVTNGNTNCYGGISTATSFQDRFPNDPNQVYERYSDSLYRMSTTAGIALAVDHNQAPRTPAAAMRSTNVGVTWQQLPGGALDVATGPNGALTVVGSNNYVYTWDGTTWNQIGGMAAAAHAAIDSSGNVWVIDTAGNIYQQQDSGFRQVGGCARDVGANGGAVWVIGCDNAIYVWTGAVTGNTFTRFEAQAQRITVDAAGNPWFLDPSGNIFRDNAGTMQQVAGCGTDIGASAGAVWLVGCTNGAIYYWTGEYGNDAWTMVTGAAANIAVTSDGYPVVSNSALQIFQGT